MSQFLSEEELELVAAKLNDWQATSDDHSLPLGTDLLPLVKAVVHLSEGLIATNALVQKGDPILGLATTMQLIDEIHARAEVAITSGEKWPKTNELSGPGSGVVTMKLLDELKYRAHVADNSDENWPHYRTVDGGFSVKVEG